MSSRKILVVEEHAHLSEGHLPMLFADVASNLAAAGCEVTVLTKRGWVLDGTGRPVPFRLVLPGSVSRAVARTAEALARVPPRAVGRRLRQHLGDLAFVLSIRRWARRLDADVVYVSVRFQSYLLLALARRGRWLVYQFVGPRSVGLSRVKRLIDRVIVSAGRARASHSGGLVVVCNNEANRQEWERAGLGIGTAYLNFASSREHVPIPDARERLGLDPEWRIVLLFGAVHPGKSPEIAFELFEELERTGELPNLHLLIVGKVASKLETWKLGAFQESRRVHVLGGYQTEEVCDLVHAAADVQLMSFLPGWDLDSGVLTDAIGWGLPVVCSSGNQTALDVERLSLGCLFAAGNRESLRDALLAVPAELDAPVLATARTERSGAAQARAHLALLDSLGS